MKYNHQEARCLFIDGPLAVYVSQAPLAEIQASLARLAMLVEVAAKSFPKTTAVFEDCKFTVGQEFR